VKKPLFFLCCLLAAFSVSAQYWQQRADFTIDASLNPAEKTIDAFERINYYNASPDTLRYIWFHLWPNAYKNDRTAFSDQMLRNGHTDFYFSKPEEMGYINRLDFKVNGITARTEDHPQHIDIVKLVLPAPLPPRSAVLITTPFHVKLPFNYSRGGYAGESFQLTQWFPKPAVYDGEGWHPMPYLDQGEFYSEFGSYDVRITVPKNYVVAATGMLQDDDEKEWLKERSQWTDSVVVKTKKASPGIEVKEADNAATKTLHFRQDSIHDFAWFADKRFIVNSDTLQLPSGRIIEAWSFYTPEEAKTWKRSTSFAKDAVRFYSSELGEYPFNTVTVVQGPESFGGGMEYPTITVISPMDSEFGLDNVIAHEVGHNWFQGILATNERDHPWMDEGMNSFYERKYMQWKYKYRSSGLDLVTLTKAARKTDQPMDLSSDSLSEVNYGLIIYNKTPSWLESMERKVGTDRFREAMQAYFREWKFRHPHPVDFKEVLSKNLGESLVDGAFTELSKTGALPDQKPQGFSVLFPFKKGAIRSYLQKPPRNILVWSPVLGINRYDKLMLGLAFGNYKLPPNKFQFFAIPLYATGSKKLTGLAKLNYGFAGNGTIRKTDIFLNAARFSSDDFESEEGEKFVMGFRKLVPGARITFRNRDPRQAISKYIQWKTYLLNEDELNATRYTIVNGTDTSIGFRYSTKAEGRYLNQLQVVYEDARALYPYRVQLQVEQSQNFIRPAATFNYFFNYRGGGLDLRLFAGKFLYLGSKTTRKQFETDRYHLNMTGANGYEDYTYSDYFIGRNEFEGFASRQIMMRDGGFKVRTDLLASKIGKTDDWLTAINLDATVPNKLNPLSVLPIKIPLRLFLDIGTYAETWKKGATSDRFLYDFGIHIPILRETFNFYFPILYNKEFADYFKSTIPKNRFFNTMSFTINFYNKDLKKANRELEF